MVHKYKKTKLFSELEGYVSKAGLGFIDEEFERSKRFGFAKEDCGCVQMATFGFPCACILAEKRKKKFPILLDEIHPHWRRLSVIGQEVDAHFFRYGGMRRHSRMYQEGPLQDETLHQIQVA